MREWKEKQKEKKEDIRPRTGVAVVTGWTHLWSRGFRSRSVELKIRKCLKWRSERPNWVNICFVYYVGKK